jgi:hypothetical protein
LCLGHTLKPGHIGVPLPVSGRLFVAISTTIFAIRTTRFDVLLSRHVDPYPDLMTFLDRDSFNLSLKTIMAFLTYYLGMSWIRIRMDPYSFSKLDPDPHSLDKQNPDPHTINADPKHCQAQTTKRLGI